MQCDVCSVQLAVYSTYLYACLVQRVAPAIFHDIPKLRRHESDEGYEEAEGAEGDAGDPSPPGQAPCVGRDESAVPPERPSMLVRTMLNQLLVESPTGAEGVSLAVECARRRVRP